MRIENAYFKKYRIPPKYEGSFIRKGNLNTIEKVGLEAIAVEFMVQHAAEEYGFDMQREDARNFIRWLADGVDILDGCYDTYEFGGYLISSFWMTENGIPMLTAYEIPEGVEEWQDEDYMTFPTVYFRLD